ncbi:hypothetical protein CpipJ_CPIJ016792 [Culex quinquefasciatus]|uniref:Uncharacterized protein n=1 Tax=Culex quinquefasciatus TaxID=7176 RepID=B0XBW0_CULQU|nr:hypothetical protein CpipJ_CPIJ016792 [Culex quinquefasciatus]|eukprot:XP_001867132.1 hypothetical protein CpipJ_CPIJ016792 [Culex quinquefasciatus]
MAKFSLLLLLMLASIAAIDSKSSILRKRTCKLVGNGLWGNHRVQRSSNSKT